MKKILAVATAFSAMFIGSAGTAYAFDAEDQAIGDAIGNNVCRYIDSAGVTASSMTELIKVIYQHPDVLTYGEAVQIINYAVHTYCPKHWPELVSFGEGARGA